MTIPTISTTVPTLPDSPSTADSGATFDAKAFALFDSTAGNALPAVIAAVNTLTTELNTGVIPQINTSTTAATSAATTATTKAAEAVSSATTAATAAAEAAALTEAYQGVHASNPTTDKHGNALTAGDWYSNAVTGATMVYNSLGQWVNNANPGVTSVNGQSGAVTITAASLGAVTSVNGQSGAVTITAASLGAVTTSAVGAASGVLGLDSLKRATPQASSPVRVSNIGNISGSVNIDLALADEFLATITGITTFAFTNAPSTSFGQFVMLKLTNAGAFGISWPAGTKFPGGSIGTLTSSGVDKLLVDYDYVSGVYNVALVQKDVK